MRFYHFADEIVMMEKVSVYDGSIADNGDVSQVGLHDADAIDDNADADADAVSQVGLHLTDSCVPAVKDNTMDSCFFRLLSIFIVINIVVIINLLWSGCHHTIHFSCIRREQN